MIIGTLKQKDNFTESETILANYILEHLADIPDLTAKQLGIVSYTSKDTVLRLCKKVNQSSYKDFQKQLLLEYTTAIHSTETSTAISGKSTIRDVAATIINLQNVISDQVRMDLDYNQLIRISEKMAESASIEIYGLGECYNLAEDFAFKLRTLGKQCTALNGFNEHATEMNSYTPLSIILSFTGANSYLRQIAETLRKNHCYVIGITGNASNEIKDACSSCIILRNDTIILGLEVLTARFAFQYILDILFVTLLSNNYDKNVQGAIEVFNGKYLYKGK